jgi:predicted membrane channel-forming protein YqfA (hemolysin III family)
MFSRKPEFILGVIFWAIAIIGSFRAFGDQWDNPRYRMFAFIPMALLAAWAWVEWREKRDPWFLRITIPFAVAVIGLTVWYLLRDYAGVKFPVVTSLAGLGALAVVAFVATLFLIRPKKAGSTG